MVCAANSRAARGPEDAQDETRAKERRDVASAQAKMGGKILATTNVTNIEYQYPLRFVRKPNLRCWRSPE